MNIFYRSELCFILVLVVMNMDKVKVENKFKVILTNLLSGITAEYFHLIGSFVLYIIGDP